MSLVAQASGTAVIKTPLCQAVTRPCYNISPRPPVCIGVVQGQPCITSKQVLHTIVGVVEAGAIQCYPIILLTRPAVAAAYSDSKGAASCVAMQACRANYLCPASDPRAELLTRIFVYRFQAHCRSARCCRKPTIYCCKLLPHCGYCRACCCGCLSYSRNSCCSYPVDTLLLQQCCCDMSMITFGSSLLMPTWHS